MSDEEVQELKANEEFIDKELSEDGGVVQNMVTIFAVFIAAAGFIGLSWYAYNSYTSNDVSIDIPIITASTDPIKIEPENPGGMDIPNQDKEVYESLIGQNKKLPEVKHILSSPEEPLDLTKVKERTITYMEEEKIEKNPVEQVAQKASPDKVHGLQTKPKDSKGEKVAAKVGYQPKIVGVEPATEDKPILAKVEETPKQVKEEAVKVFSKKAVIDEHALEKIKLTAKDIKPMPKKMKGKFKKSEFRDKKKVSGYKVQLASFKSQSDASTGWKRVSKVFSALLAEYQPSIIKKNLKGKGIVYRLQVGPFTDKSAARNLCNKLKSSKQGCFVLKSN